MIYFIDADRYEQNTGKKLTRKRAVEDMAWAAKVVKVEGGYRGFPTLDAWRNWKNQK